MSDPAIHLSEGPRIEWQDDRPFAISRLSIDYASSLENLALIKEDFIKTLPIDPGWERIANTNPTTARYRSYSTFLLSPLTLPLFFAIRETYRFLLKELGHEPTPRFIQCWYNIHRGGEALVRHKHNYPFIGTFSANAEGSVTRYGKSRQTSESDVVVQHVNGQLMITTGPEHYHETSVWRDPDRARVTYAFDIINPEQWNPTQVFLPFDA